MPKRTPAPSSPRDENGRFLKGHSGNRGGRPKKSAVRSGDDSEKIAIKQGGRTRRVAATPLIMKRLMKSAIAENDLSAARLYLREDRLRAKLAAAKAGPPSGRSPPRSAMSLLYHERALLALGVYRLNGLQQIVIPAEVFADLDRRYSKGDFGPREWKAIQLAVQSPRVLRTRYPTRQLNYKSEAQANRARTEALAEAFAEFEAMKAELEELRRFKAKHTKNRPPR